MNDKRNTNTKLIFILLALSLITMGMLSASSLTSTARVTISNILINAGSFSTAKDESTIDCVQQFTAGTGDQQVDVIYQAQRGLASGTVETIDLIGSLTNGIGTAANFAHVKAIYFRNLGTETFYVGNATAAFTGWLNSTASMAVPPMGQTFWSDPYAGATATANVSDEILIKNSGTQPASYNILILGVSQ
jgi:hypothetical protein